MFSVCVAGGSQLGWGKEQKEGQHSDGSLASPLPSHTIFIQGWESDAATSGSPS